MISQRSNSTFKKIAIHGVPRSGTTWVGEIFNSSPCVVYRYQPLFSYTLKGSLDGDITIDKVHSFFMRLKTENDAFLSQKEGRAAGILPTFAKAETTHVAYKEVRYHQLLPRLVEGFEDIKFVFVLRNPIAVINSWLNAPKEFRADLGWRREEEWWFAPKKNLGKPEEFNGFEKWKEATALFLRLGLEYPDRVKCVSYSALLRDPLSQAKLMFEHAELDWSGQTEDFLCREVEMADENAYSVMKRFGVDDRWKGQLEPSIVSAIRRDLAGSELEFLMDQ